VHRLYIDSGKLFSMGDRATSWLSATAERRKKGSPLPDVLASEPIEKVKEGLQEKEGIPPDQQVLKFEGQAPVIEPIDKVKEGIPYDQQVLKFEGKVDEVIPPTQIEATVAPVVEEKKTVPVDNLEEKKSHRKKRNLKNLKIAGILLGVGGVIAAVVAAASSSGEAPSSEATSSLRLKTPTANPKPVTNQKCFRFTERCG